MFHRIEIERNLDAEEHIGLYGVTYQFSSPGPSVLITGAIHGDEVTSTGAIKRLWRELEHRELTGKISLVPCVNQLAVRASSRLIPLEATDLNRHFPGRSDGSLAERLAHELIELLKEHDYLLDVHTAGWCRSYVLIDDIPDEDFRSRVLTWAGQSQLPVIGEMPADQLALQGLDRSFSAWAAVQMGKPALTVELPGFHTLDSRGAKRGADALLRLIEALPRLEELEGMARPPRSRHEIFTATGGLFEALVSVEDETELEPDTQIGILHAYTGSGEQPVFANQKGLLLALQPLSAVHAGSWLATLAVNPE